MLETPETLDPRIGTAPPAPAVPAPGADDPVALRRTAGVVGLAGAVVMLGSAILMVATGPDIFTAIEDRTMGAYLAEAAEHRTVLTVHLALWIVGALAMALAVSLVAASSARSASALAARFVAAAAGGAVVVFFPMMMGVVHGLPGHPELVPVADAIGFAAVAADDVATVLILGVGGFLAVFSGRDRWAPRWLVRLGWVSLIVSLASLLPLGAVSLVTGYLVVLVGEALIISMSIVGLRGAPAGTGVGTGVGRSVR